MPIRRFNLFVIGAMFVGIASSYAQFTAGNLAVTRVGDGSTTLGGLGNSVSVLEYTTVGSLVNTFNFATSGADAFLMTGNATAEGALSRSSNNRFLTLAGYNTAPLGSGSLASSTSAAVPRSVGQLDFGGSISIPVKSTTAFSANSFRSTVSDGANNYWSLGVGTGVTYMGNVGSQATIETAQTTLRVMNIVAGSIFFTAAGGVFQIAGTPTSGTATPTAVITTTGTGVGTSSSYDFAFNAGMTLAYVADDRTVANGGGIQRWDFNGSAWVLSYTLSAGGSGARGLAVDFSGVSPVIFATTTEATNNRIISIIDVGGASTSIDLATSGTLRAFRGLDFTPVPEPSTFVLIGLGLAGLIVVHRLRRQ